jgi:hypothetical protein
LVAVPENELAVIVSTFNISLLFISISNVPALLPPNKVFARLTGKKGIRPLIIPSKYDTL